MPKIDLCPARGRLGCLHKPVPLGAYKLGHRCRSSHRLNRDTHGILDQVSQRVVQGSRLLSHRRCLYVNRDRLLQEGIPLRGFRAVDREAHPSIDAGVGPDDKLVLARRVGSDPWQQMPGFWRHRNVDAGRIDQPCELQGHIDGTGSKFGRFARLDGDVVRASRQVDLNDFRAPRMISGGRTVHQRGGQRHRTQHQYSGCDLDQSHDPKPLPTAGPSQPHPGLGDAIQNLISRDPGLSGLTSERRSEVVIVYHGRFLLPAADDLP
jgi:hypothetical protein